MYPNTHLSLFPAFPRSSTVFVGMSFDEKFKMRWERVICPAVSRIMEPAQIEGLTDPDSVPDLPGNPVSVPGDLWILGKHRLICGDSTFVDQVQRLFNGVQAVLMVTDPPYGVDYDPKWRNSAGLSKTKRTGAVKNDDRVDWGDTYSLFPGDIAYIWHAGRHASEVQASIERCGFEIRCQIIWAKPRFAISRSHYHWQHEPCC